MLFDPQRVVQCTPLGNPKIVILRPEWAIRVRCQTWATINHMRNSKSRNRSKNNRNRSVGNVINRVFDSSGPEGKVRGTPQQIIDKYNQLARDAQLSGDRVAVENFQQHSEHYMRLLAEAQREQDARREQQEKENRDRQAQRDQDRADRKDTDGGSQDPSDMPQPDALAVDGGDSSPLVATPEQADDQPKPKPRRKRAPKPKSDEGADAATDAAPAPDAAPDATPDAAPDTAAE